MTDSHGVIVPKDNLKHLGLKGEVVEAVRSGMFHVYGVSTIDEGIEVLTGTAAGEMQEDGTYPEGTVHYLVEQRLEDLAQSAKDDEAPESESRDSEGETEESAGFGG